MVVSDISREVRIKLRKLLEFIEGGAPGLILKALQNLIARPKKSFSLYGEDVVLKGIFDRYTFQTGKVIDFSYIDIGGWRPISGSNTYLFYKAGSRGTVIEPNLHFKKSWRACRPGDNLINVACSNSKIAFLNYFHAGAASNTLSEDFASKISSSQNFEVIQQIQVPTQTLSEIIDSHLTIFPGPFLLDLDIEGLDFDVIREFHFADPKRPLVILIEDTADVGSRISESSISKLLFKQRYGLAARVALTSIFINLDSELADQVSLV
jgi:FkbM family methyltransferase